MEFGDCNGFECTIKVGGTLPNLAQLILAHTVPSPRSNCYNYNGERAYFVGASGNPHSCNTHVKLTSNSCVTRGPLMSVCVTL